jgi:hypothetical protein
MIDVGTLRPDFIYTDGTVQVLSQETVQVQGRDRCYATGYGRLLQYTPNAVASKHFQHSIRHQTNGTVNKKNLRSAILKQISRIAEVPWVIGLHQTHI